MFIHKQHWSDDSHTIFWLNDCSLMNQATRLFVSKESSCGWLAGNVLNIFSRLVLKSSIRNPTQSVVDVALLRHSRLLPPTFDVQTGFLDSRARIMKNLYKCIVDLWSWKRRCFFYLGPNRVRVSSCPTTKVEICMKCLFDLRQITK